jgi:hypothetical protein
MNNFTAMAFRLHALRQQFDDLHIALAQFPHGELLQSCIGAHNRAFIGSSTEELAQGSAVLVSFRSVHQ